MDSKEQDDFYTRLKDVLKIANCPVCFDRISPEAVCCVNGHVVCGRCKQNMRQCPTCRDSFAEIRNTFISQLLLALPYACENDDCLEIKFDKKGMEEHEIWCSLRITKCQKCAWTGKLKDLMCHVREEAHYGGSSETDAELNLILPNIDQNFSKLFYSIYYEQFFWRLQTLDENKERLIFQYICVPNEKAKNSHFVIKVDFESDETKISMETKLRMNRKIGTMEASLIFDTDMIKQFNQGNQMKYKFRITQHKEQ